MVLAFLMRSWKFWGTALFVLFLVFSGWKWGMPRYALWELKRDLDRQQYIAASEWFPQAADADPAAVHFLHARWARKLGRYDVMLRQLKAAARLGFERQRVELEVVLAEAQRGRLAPLESQMADLFTRGIEPDEVCEAFVEGCLLKYRLDDAVRVLDLWEADYPEDPRPNFLRGRILEHRVNLAGARQEFEKALRKNSQFAPAAYNLGRILVTEQQPRKALTWYGKSVDTLGNPQPGLVGQAHCHRLLGEYAKAERLLLLAQAASDDFLEAAYRLVGDPADSASAKLPAEFGLLYAAQNDYERAAEHLTKAVEANPKDWRNRYQLGIALRQIGRLKEAAHHLQIVDETKQALAQCDRLMSNLQGDPGDVEARFQIGKVFLKYVSENQGLVWLNSVLDYDPNHRGAHEVLESYFREHDQDNPEYSALARHHRNILSTLSGAEQNK